MEDLERMKEEGNMAFRRGDYSEAERIYSLILEEDGDNYIILNNRGMTYIKENKYGFGYCDIKEAMRINSSNPKCHYRLGLIFMNIGMLEDALHELEVSRELMEDRRIVEETIKSVEESIKGKNYQRVNGRASIMGWGSNAEGGCGIPQVAQCLRPKTIERLSGLQFLDLACGLGHTIAITTEGLVFSWGLNSFKQCAQGDNDNGNICSPSLIPFFMGKHGCGVACGAAHSLLQTREGDLYAWGLNSYGQCSLPTPHTQNPKIIPSPRVIPMEGRNVKGVACGLGHSFILCEGGKVYSCGWNNSGQLGHSNGCEEINEFHEVEMPPSVEVQHIACGGGHSMLVTSQGLVYAMGLNTSGQLGLGDTHNRSIPTLLQLNYTPPPIITLTSTGEEFSILLTTTNHIFTFGLNNVGQLGRKTEEFQSTQPGIIPAISDHNIEDITCSQSTIFAINRSGVVYYWGKKPFSDMEEFVEGPEVLGTFKHKEISHIAGGRHYFNIMMSYSDPMQFSAFGSCINNTIAVGSKQKIRVTARDINGNMRMTGGDRVTCMISDIHTGKLILKSGYYLGGVEIWDMMSGQYELSFKIPVIGDYYIYIFVHGKEIQLSPFLCYVKAGECDPSNSIGKVISYRNNEEGDICEYRANEFIDIQLVLKDGSGNIIEELISTNTIISIEDINVLLDDQPMEYFKFQNQEIKLQVGQSGFHTIKLLIKDTQINLVLEYPLLSDRKMKIFPKLQILIPTGFAVPKLCNIIKESYKRFNEGEESNLDNSIRVGEGHQYILQLRDMNSNPTNKRYSSFQPDIHNIITQIEFRACSVNYVDNTVIVTFRMSKPGVYKIINKLGKEKINPSDYLYYISVLNGPPDKLFTQISKDALQSETIKTGEELHKSIQIIAKDEFGNICEKITDNDIIGTIQIIGGKAPNLMKLTNTNNSKGIYYLDYDIKVKGQYLATILLNKSHAYGSPFEITFNQDPIEIEKEKQRLLELEQAKLDEIRRLQEELEKERMEEEARLAKLEEENKQNELERIRLAEEKLKREEEMREKEKKRNEKEEMERRKRIYDRIKKVQELDRQKEEEARKLKEKWEKDVKKQKRCGGGFVVPFDKGEKKPELKLQNFVPKE